MIDIFHTRGCGELAYRVFGVPVGRDFIGEDCMVPVFDEDGHEVRMAPGASGNAVRCASCGKAATLDEAREQTGIQEEEADGGRTNGT